MKLYVYCLLEGIDEMNGPVRGTSGAQVRLQALENLGVLVSDFDADAIPVTRENARPHAAVVRSVLDCTTPLPFRFGTLVTEQQLRSYVSARRPALERNLALGRGGIEMGAKIIWPVSEEVSKEKEELKEPQQGTGATFLAAKRRELLGSELRTA